MTTYSMLSVAEKETLCRKAFADCKRLQQVRMIDDFSASRSETFSATVRRRRGNTSFVIAAQDDFDSITAATAWAERQLANQPKETA